MMILRGVLVLAQVALALCHYDVPLAERYAFLLRRPCLSLPRLASPCLLHTHKTYFDLQD